MRIVALLCLSFLWTTSTCTSTLENVDPAPQEDEDGALLRRRTLQGTQKLNDSGTHAASFLERLGADFGINSPRGERMHKSKSYTKKCHGKGKGGSGSNGGKCKKKVRALDLVWKGSQTVKVSSRQGIATIPPGGEVEKDAMIKIKFLTDENDQYIDIYEGDTKIGQSVFHISCSDNDMNDYSDCYSYQGNGKKDDSQYTNKWMLVGLKADQSGSFICGDVNGISQGNSDEDSDANEDCGCYDCEGDDKVCIDGHCLPCGKHTQYCCDLEASSGCEDNLICADSGYADGKCVIECLVSPPTTDQPDCDCSTSSTTEACPPCDETTQIPDQQCPPCGGLDEDCCDDLACRDDLTCAEAKCIAKIEQCAPVGDDCGVYLDDDSFCGCCNSTQDGQLDTVAIVEDGQEIKCALNTCCLPNIGDVGCTESNPNTCCGDLVCGKDSNAVTSNVIDSTTAFDTCCLPNGKKTCLDQQDCCESDDCSDGICCNKGFGECNADNGDTQCCGKRTCIDPDGVADGDTSDDICCALLEDEGTCDGNNEKCCHDLLCGLQNVVDNDSENPQQDVCCVPSWSPDLVTDPPGNEPKCTPGKFPLNKVLVDSSSYTLEDANECCDANSFCDPHGRCVTCLEAAGEGCTSNDVSCCGDNLRCSHDGNNKCCVNNGRSGCNIGFGDDESLCCNSVNVCDDGRCCIETGLIPPDKGRIEDRAEGCGSSDFVCCDDNAVCFGKRCCLPPGSRCDTDEKCCGKEKERQCKMTGDEARTDPFPGTCCVKDFGRCRGSIDCCTDDSKCIDLSPIFPDFPSFCLPPLGECMMGDDECSSDEECCGYGFVVDWKTVYCDVAGNKTCQLKKLS